MYRILTAGSIFHGYYNAPFVKAKEEGKEGFLERCGKKLHPEDFEFLKTFPVYNFGLQTTAKRLNGETQSTNIFWPVCGMVDCARFQIGSLRKISSLLISRPDTMLVETGTHNLCLLCQSLLILVKWAA